MDYSKYSKLLLLYKYSRLLWDGSGGERRQVSAPGRLLWGGQERETRQVSAPRSTEKTRASREKYASLSRKPVSRNNRKAQKGDGDGTCPLTTLLADGCAFGLRWHLARERSRTDY